MMQPKRIQRKRTRGWKKPKGSVYVGRPTPFGNPYRIGQSDPMIVGSTMDAQDTVRMYQWFLEQVRLLHPDSYSDMMSKLRGKDLACWCAVFDTIGNRVYCHADVLLSLANDIPLEEICAPWTMQNSQAENALNAR
jgi:hypothetical protein